ncbi:galactose mutarotase-like [Glandiceps talaboti]
MSNTSITTDVFGKTKDGKEVKRYKLKNSNGMTVELISVGAAITSVQVPDKAGNYKDVVPGYPTVEGYETDPFFYGVVVGRAANRTAKGKLSIDGQEYQLTVNNGPNHLHGGYHGFCKAFWDSSIEDDLVKFTYVSPDGEEGYPGELTTQVTYQLTEDNEIIFHVTASCKKATLVNLVNHCYFNLAGHDAPNIYDHQITIPADSYTPLDETSVPTGEIKAVQGTLFDLREPVTVGDRIHKVPGGYDINFCYGPSNNRHLYARLVDPKSGRLLEAYTTQPGVQFYTGNFLDGSSVGKDGAKYPKHSGLCLEAQNYPDAANHPNFPNAVLRPGETYDHTTWYKFSVTK